MNTAVAACLAVCCAGTEAVAVDMVIARALVVAMAVFLWLLDTNVSDPC